MYVCALAHQVERICFDYVLILFFAVIRGSTVTVMWIHHFMWEFFSCWQILVQFNRLHKPRVLSATGRMRMAALAWLLPYPAFQVQDGSTFWRSVSSTTAKALNESISFQKVLFFFCREYYIDFVDMYKLLSGSLILFFFFFFQFKKKMSFPYSVRPLQVKCHLVKKNFF